MIMWNRLRSITTGLWVSGQSRQGCPSYPRAAPLGSSHHHCHPRCHTKLEVGAFSIIELDNYWLDTATTDIIAGRRQLWRLKNVPSCAIHRFEVVLMGGGMDVPGGRVSTGPAGGDGGWDEHPGGLPGVRVAPGHGAQDSGLLSAAGLPAADSAPAS